MARQMAQRQRQRPRPRNSRGLPASGPFLALLLALAPLDSSALDAAAPVRTRAWDELRVADVDPHKIMAFATTEHSQAGFLNMAKVYFFGRDWLQIRGSAIPGNFLSSGFEFSRLDYPHEWSAKIKRPLPVVMRVGRTCNCTLEGISAYTKDDATAWMRLQFDHCTGCESTASRAAVVVPLQPDPRLDSNLYQWMCAISDHAACAGIEQPTTSTLGALTTTVAPAPAATTTNPKCNFDGGLVVKTKATDIGRGRCITASAGSVATRTMSTPSAQGCETLCETTYGPETAPYKDSADAQANITKINNSPNVCRGYEYTVTTHTCVVYMVELQKETDKSKDGEDSECVVDVHATSITSMSSLASECTTLAPTTTVTTTSATSTTMTTTGTRKVEVLNFADLFTAHAEGGRVYGDPGETHFPRPGFEATLLQMQSHCFQDIDYYLLGMALPIHETHWSQAMRLMNDYGQPDAWAPTELDDCPTSVSVDRLPVDADLAQYSGAGGLSEAYRLMMSLGLSIFLGLVGGYLAMFFKQQLGDDDSQGLQASGATLFAIITVAVVAAVLTVPVVYGTGQLVSWFFERLAVKSFAKFGSASLFAVAPLLSDLCLPAALTAACATLVIWLMPTLSGEHCCGASPGHSDLTDSLARDIHLTFDSKNNQVRMRDPNSTTSSMIPNATGTFSSTAFGTRGSYDTMR